MYQAITLITKFKTMSKRTKVKVRRTLRTINKTMSNLGAGAGHALRN